MEAGLRIIVAFDFHIVMVVVHIAINWDTVIVDKSFIATINTTKLHILQSIIKLTLKQLTIIIKSIMALFPMVAHIKVKKNLD